MITIDSHQHFWKYHPHKDTWITDEMKVIARDFLPEDLLPVLAKNRVDGCMAVQAAASEEETAYLLNLAAQHEAIKGVVGWVNLLDAEVSKRLEHFSSNNWFKGIRYNLQSESPEFLYHASFRQGLAELGRFDLTYDLLVYPQHLSGVIDLVDTFPNQAFVLDHLGKPEISRYRIDEWATEIKTLAQFSNVHCKVSGMVTEADWNNWTYDDMIPFLDVIFTNFGTDRILFGSDWPVCLLAGSYSEVKGILATYMQHLSRDERAKIWGLNAKRFYKL